ncbi:MAG: hypothetical protein H6630_08965 [Arcobacter sp.]|nr:hypothetical protein [Arcobacter sp.]
MNINNSTGTDSNLNIFNIENTPNTGENDDLELQFNISTDDLTLYNKVLPSASSVVNLSSLNSDGNYLKLNGSSEMEGNINLNNNKIINSSNPTDDNDVTNKKYVDDAISGGTTGTFLPITGGTLTGNLNVNSDNGVTVTTPNTKYGLTHKNGDIEMATYINSDSTIAACQIGTRSNHPLSFYVNNSGGAVRINTDSTLDLLENRIVGIGAPINYNDAATKQYIDDLWSSLSNGTLVDGINMNSNLITNLQDPEQALDATNKRYVDSKIVTQTEEFFKVFQLNYKNFSNYGLWDQVDLHAYVKVLSIYMIRDPLINNEIINLNPYNNAGAYKSIVTPKNNPSAFQFYGKCYTQSGSIKKGKFETVINIPLCTSSDSALSASYLYNQYPKINCQAILGKAPTIDTNNITVECYCAQTKIVTMIGGRNTYGNNVASTYNPSTDKQPIFQIQMKYSFFVPYDLSTNELYIYLNFSASDNSTISGKYFNCLFGDVFSDMTRDTFYINGYTTYTNQTSTILTNDETIMTGTEQQGNLINSYFKYNLVNNQSVYNHDYTYLSIDEIKKIELENNYIHSVTKKNTTASNNLIQLNLNPFNTNHNVFYDDDMMIDNIINITLHIKQLSTNGSIQLLFRFKNDENVTSSESQTLNLINSDNWETYTLNLSDYKNQNLKLTSLDLVIDKNTLLSFDWFNFHYVSGNDIKNKFIYWTIWNNNNVLQYTKPDEVQDLSHRVQLLEDYINLLKQTYEIIED